jgi:hypothetical protein
MEAGSYAERTSSWWPQDLTPADLHTIYKFVLIWAFTLFLALESKQAFYFSPLYWWVQTGEDRPP